jgi:acetyltransferase-like isoleucine patch superfamily enzyme
VRAIVSRLLAGWRRLQLKTWVVQGKSRMKWVGIRFEAELGDGVVFVRHPFLLAGVEPPGVPGTLVVRLGDRVRFAPGVIIEAEPGKHSVLEIAAGTRIGANVHFHLRGCVLKTSGGDIELADRCFMSYGCVLHATESVVMRERVALGERVTLVDSGHDTDGSDVHWAIQDVPAEPVVVGANTLVFANAVLTMGAHVGANSQVAAGALVRGEHPDGALLAGVPARVVKSLSDD